MIVIDDGRGINERGGCGVTHVSEEWAAGSVKKRREKKERKKGFDNIILL